MQRGVYSHEVIIENPLIGTDWNNTTCQCDEGYTGTMHIVTPSYMFSYSLLSH